MISTAIQSRLFFRVLGFAAVSILIFNAPVWAQTQEERILKLEKELDALKSEMKKDSSDDSVFKPIINEVEPEESSAAAKEDDDFGLTYRTAKGLSLGAYGEAKVRYQDTPHGHETGFDDHRLVFIGNYDFTENIILNFEVEFEHADEVYVEQAFIDFMFNKHFNWRAPGIDLVPIGFINLYHEPVLFYSTERPELYRELIPSTWAEGSTSIFGEIVEGLNYQIFIGTGIEDNSSPGNGMAGITGAGGLRPGRPDNGNFNQANNDLSYAARLSYQVPFVQGLEGSTSGYFTRTTARLVPGNTAPFLGKTGVGLIDTELRYRMPSTGLELRGEYVYIFLDNAGNLLANHDGNVTNNTGDSMYGYHLEASYHYRLDQLGLKGELVPFYRYSRISLQNGGYQGSDINAPTGQGNRQIHTFGAAYFPIEQVVLKLDYTMPLDDSPFGPQANRLQGAVGFFF